MNILFVFTDPIIRNDGGISRVTSVLAENFLKAGHKAYYLALRSGNFSHQEAGIEQYYLPFDKLSAPANSKYYTHLQRKLCIDIIVNQAGVQGGVIDFVCGHLLKEVKVVTVHHNCIRCLHENYKNILMGGRWAFVLKALNYPLVWKWLTRRSIKKWTGYFRSAVHKSDRLVLLSPLHIPELKHYITDWPENRVVAIHNPTSFLSQPHLMGQKENRILYVGRLEIAQKQAQLLIPIWEKINTLYPDWHLDIVGNGCLDNFLRQEIDSKQLTNIHLHGFQHPEPFLEKAKILVMTSSFEGWGMVLVEAQAFGAVPVAFNSFPSLKYLLGDFHAGIGVTPFSVDQFADRLDELIQSDKKRVEMADYGFRLAQRYNPDKIVGDWCDLFKKLKTSSS